jgi:taurine dioxygenase
LENGSHFSQPIFIRHPNTKKVALYVNLLMTAKINELPKDESANLLVELFVISQDQSVVYEHVWTVDNLFVWHNLCSMHVRTNFTAEERRLLRRFVLEGEAVFAA